MPQILRDPIQGELTIDYLARKWAEGWRITAIEWTHDKETASPGATTLLGSERTLPYGLHLVESGSVEESSYEAAVLLLVLDQIIRERRLQEIAAELNQHGYATRSGIPWTASDVFNLLPRVIETGPAILKSDIWAQRKSRGAESKLPN